MPVRNYRDLVAWKKAFQLTLAIYEETSYFPVEEKYGITSQLRKAGDPRANFATSYLLLLDP